MKILGFDDSLTAGTESKDAKEGCSLEHLLVADVFSKLTDDNSILQTKYDSGDGLHLSVEGYRRIGELLWDDVVRTLV
jgi:lysophospholipase L1-like esterase